MGAAEGKLASAEVIEDKNKEETESDDTLVQAEKDAEEENTSDEVAEEEDSKAIRKITPDDIKTAPFDIRFPTTNQTKHCYTRYCEFHKCQNEKGEGATECVKYKKYYRSLCPNEWVERWDEQRAEGNFAGPY